MDDLEQMLKDAYEEGWMDAHNRSDTKFPHLMEEDWNVSVTKNDI